MTDLSEAQFSDLLDEVLFHYFKNGNQDAEQAELTLDATIVMIAKREHYTQSAEDIRAIAALAYEQLTPSR